jgi:hypothetical protein
MLDSESPSVRVVFKKEVERGKARRISRRAMTRLYLKDGMTEDDKPMTLREAAERFGLTLSTLRAEQDRGRLTTYRIGRRDYTTTADIRGMIQECRVEPRARDFTLIRNESSGPSATERASSGLARANETALRLKSISRNTSPISISPKRQARR